jgi:metallo-beta-lactamase family protein
MLSVTFCGAARTVTGSQYFMEYQAPDGSTFSFCLDSGMFQVGQKVNLFKLNSRLVFDPKKLDAIVLSHAHLDHCGRIPYLVKSGFGGRIYSTEATKEIAEIVMRDASKHVGEGEMAEFTTDGKLVKAEDDSSVEKKPTEMRLYDMFDVESTMTRFRTHEYHDKFTIHPNLQVEFYDAGHILGSASVVFTELSSGRQIVFSGDLGNPNKPIIEDPEMIHGLKNVTHIFTETTYGNRLHPKFIPKERLKMYINETIKQKNGKILIPSFSVERAQEVIYFIVELMREGKIPNIPVYLDSPMAERVLEVCLGHPELYDEALRDKIKNQANPLIYKHLKILTSIDESKSLNAQHDSCIIIAGSGMMNGGRILKHLKFNIENPHNTLLIVGYQAEGTLGRQIVDKVPEVEIEGRMFKVNCRVEAINEFSAHADQLQLKKWIVGIVQDIDRKRKDYVVPTVFLMHGEKDASLTLGTELINAYHENIHTYWPRFAEKVVMWEK